MAERKNIEINDKTTINLFAVLGSLLVLGGILWGIAFTAFKVDAATEKNVEQDAKFEMIYDMREDIGEIKGALGIKNKKKSRAKD